MTTIFQKRLAAQARAEYDRFRLLRENQEPLASRIAQYWRDLGFAFPGVQVAWSAVFVSWCVRSAGATAEQFKFAKAHSQFVFVAIQNESAGTGVFQGYAPSTYQPKVGDVLQNNRAGNSFDYGFAAAHKAYESHSAVVVEVGVDARGKYLHTVGGNESDSVGLKEVRLSAAGKVLNTSGLYISVIETLL
jgi:hypothetical protein